MFEKLGKLDIMTTLTCCYYSLSKKFCRQRTNMWQKTTTMFFVTLILLLACEKSYSQTLNRLNNSDEDDTSEEYSTPPSSLLGCSSCGTRDDLKTRNLEAIKGDVLKKMGFKNAPNVTTKTLPYVPMHVLAMIDNSEMLGDQPQYKTGPFISEEDDDFHIKTEKIISFAQQYPRLRHSWRGHDILHFVLSDSVTKYQVGNATLFVYVKGVGKRPQPSFQLDIFKVFKNSNHPDTPGKIKVASRRVLQPLGQGDWIKIDITVMVSEWFKSVRDNYGFIINGTVNGVKVVFTDPSLDAGKKTPFMEVSTMDVKRRTRRNLGLYCDDKMNEPLCCRYPLTVDFEEFGWDFIIAPKRYEANYCAGDCPFLTLQKHAHTHLMELASPTSAGPCCAPRKMSPISMLYFDQHSNIVYGNLPGMVVDRCGCS